MELRSAQGGWRNDAHSHGAQPCLCWTLLTLIPVSVPVGAEPFDVPVYQSGLEELQERAVQQDKHSHLLQSIVDQMVSLAKQLEANTQPLALT